MAKKKQIVKVYVVQKYQWQYSDEYFYHDDEGEAIQTFRDRKKAEAYRDAQERELHTVDFCSPFEVNALEFENQTSLTFRQFQAGVRKLGLEPPGHESDRFDWWQDHADEYTADQRFGIWQLMDKARFYEIVETELEVEA